MKTSEPKNSEDLDAGWDTGDDVDVGWDKGDHRASSPSVRQINSVAPPATDDLDLAWDTSAPETPLGGPAPKAAESAKQKQLRKKPAPVKVAAVAAPSSALPATPPPHKLTKKERRDLERQQRAYSAKKQAEIRRQRKEQRRSVASLNERSPRPDVAATPPVGAKTKAIAKAKPPRKTNVRRADRPEPPHDQQDMQVAPRAARRSNRQVESARVSPSDAPEPAEETKPRQRHMALWTIVIVVVVLTLLFFLQKR
jgi:hypothetical protein